MIQAANHVVSRRIDPLEPGVISICMIHAGNSPQCNSEMVELGGTVRSMSEATRDLLLEELERACKIVEPLGGSYELRVGKGYPSLINDPHAASMALATLGAMLGENQVFVKDQ